MSEETPKSVPETSASESTLEWLIDEGKDNEVLTSGTDGGDSAKVVDEDSLPWGARPNPESYLLECAPRELSK